MKGGRFQMPDTGCQMMDAGDQIPDIGCRMPDAGYQGLSLKTTLALKYMQSCYFRNLLTSKKRSGAGCPPI